MAIQLQVNVFQSALQALKICLQIQIPKFAFLAVLMASLQRTPPEDAYRPVFTTSRTTLTTPPIAAWVAVQQIWLTEIMTLGDAWLNVQASQGPSQTISLKHALWYVPMCRTGATPTTFRGFALSSVQTFHTVILQLVTASGTAQLAGTPTPSLICVYKTARRPTLLIIQRGDVSWSAQLVKPYLGKRSIILVWEFALRVHMLPSRINDAWLVVQTKMRRF
jgi:hypothetical protein